VGTFCSLDITPEGGGPVLYREFWNLLNKRRDECCRGNGHGFRITRDIIKKYDRGFAHREDAIDFQLGSSGVVAFLGQASCDCMVLRAMRPKKRLCREWKDTMIHNRKGKCKCARCVSKSRW